MNNGVFAKFAQKALDLIYPENLYCLCCEDTMEQSRVHGICDNCAQKINWLAHNPLEDRMDEFAFDEVYSCCVYGFFARKIIHGLKLHNRTYIAKNVGLLMADKLRRERPNASAEFSMIVPVPSSPEKLKKRGFNQAELLAREVAKELEMAVAPDALEKIRETGSLRLASGEERRHMLDGAFAASEKYLEIIRGANILLVDDVMTTGSTADACARALKDAGAKSVALLCFASGDGSTAVQ